MTAGRRKALVKVGYGCNENCTFCHTQDVRHIDGGADEISARIRRAAALGHDMVVLSGGEPTIRPEIVRWADEIAAQGMDLGLVTNGLALAYPELVDKLVARRLRYVYMSLHGGDERTNRLMVRTEGAFATARAAIANLAARDLELTLNAVVTRGNLHALRPIVDVALCHPTVCLKFSMLQPKGGGQNAFPELMPKVSEVATAVQDAIAYGRSRAGAGGPRFTHDGIPLCLLPGLEGDYDDLRTDGFATMIDIGEGDFFPIDDRARIQPAPCQDCALRGPCPGLYREYHAAFGDRELAPRHDRPRSNSFNYVFEALVPDDPRDACPLRADGVAPWDRARHLFVRHGGRTARYHTATRDFADVELEDLKHRRGQLYVDVSRKNAPDDFARDLVKLRRADLCTGCPEHDGCTGMWQPELEDVFTADDARVRDLVADLHGDVLDVGAGDGPYDDILGPLATAGAIRYVAVEPDPARARTLRARRPWATVVTGTAEEAPLVGAFDHVLILRSWNHLREPARALGRLGAALRPGGQLLVVDNVAFGLARTVAQARRAESSPAGFEHYRNDDAATASAQLEDAGLVISARTEVGPARSNQWFVLCRRSL